MNSKEVDNIIETLKELEEDVTVPRNVRSKIQNTVKILQDESETSIKISKALHYLEDIADDVNLQSYTRTQRWNIVSLLEKG